MITLRSATLGAAACLASMSMSYAGPCSGEIDRVQARVDAKLEARAATGPSGPESAAATRHQQPTPGSIAAAESRLGDFSAATVAAIKAGMTRAREADRAGDAAACEQRGAACDRSLILLCQAKADQHDCKACEVPHGRQLAERQESDQQREARHQ
jgi:hypothetical protein